MSAAPVVLAAPFSLPDAGPNPVSLLLLLAGMSVLPFLLVMFTGVCFFSLTAMTNEPSAEYATASPTARSPRSIRTGRCFQISSNDLDPSGKISSYPAK